MFLQLSENKLVLFRLVQAGRIFASTHSIKKKKHNPRKTFQFTSWSILNIVLKGA